MQILGTRWVGTTPHLQVAGPDGPTTIAPDGAFDWHLGERTCTGYYDDGWHPCPDKALVGHEWQCLLCFRGRGDSLRRDDLPECIFEPRCKGSPEKCMCSFGSRNGPVEHVVYIAFYGPLPKVGMTSATRVHTRLVEQGADAYFIAQRTPDRQSARATEERIAFLHGLPEWRRHDEVLPQWAKPTDRARIERVAAQWHSDLAQRFAPEELVHIENMQLPAVPEKVHVAQHMEGTWVGGRGPYWFYEPAPNPMRLDVGAPLLALKRTDLVGRWVD